MPSRKRIEFIHIRCSNVINADSTSNDTHELADSNLAQ
jgi:hypothetical protein